MNVRCPNCGAVGEAENEQGYLARGRDGTKGIFMCRTCKQGLSVSISGKAKKIDAFSFGRMMGSFETHYRRATGQVPEGSMGASFFSHPCPWCRTVSDAEVVQKCPGCGRKIAGLKCLNCGAPVAIRDYTCESCGASLDWKSREE